jgi:dihydroxyacetone kinase-like protein
MKKFINDPKNLTRELLEGFAIAHGNLISVKSEKIVCRTIPKPENKVALVSMSGAGHEPALCGFVGEGMLDYTVAGDIFAAPGPPRVIEALRMAKRKAGTLLIVFNHAGDVMSAGMAEEMAEQEGISVKKFLVCDDIAPGADAPAEERRGLVGGLMVTKIAGAAAEEGRSLDEVYALAKRFHDNLATLGVALKTATHPASGLAMFHLAEDEMEIGMGSHGEAGSGPCKLLTADQTAGMMLSRLLPAVKAGAGDKIILMINGCGATTLMEMYIVLRGCKKFLDARGISLAAAPCGEFLTVQEMAGFQMSVAKVDDELLRYWNAPCHTPALTNK